MARPGVLQDEVVDVVGALPELLDAIPAERLRSARHALRARSILVRKGRWEAMSDARLTDGGVGFLILDGAMVRCVTAAHRTSGELLGPGDLIRPDYDLSEEPPFGTYWRAISDVRLAVLDARFTRAAAFVPETALALIASVTRRTGAVSRQLVIVQSQAVENRILILLRYLADRWGVMTREGLVLPSFLSHGTLSLLLGARRPSVTSAMVRLSGRGMVERREDGRWVLPPEEQAESQAPAPAAAA
jgi:CRP/FNR family transcriptional regulator, cyclic AMP receptor protein